MISNLKSEMVVIVQENVDFVEQVSGMQYYLWRDVAYWDNENVSIKNLFGNVVGSKGAKISFDLSEGEKVDHFDIERRDGDDGDFKHIGTLCRGNVNEGTYFVSACNI